MKYSAVKRRKKGREEGKWQGGSAILPSHPSFTAFLPSFFHIPQMRGVRSGGGVGTGGDGNGGGSGGVFGGGEALVDATVVEIEKSEGRKTKEGRWEDRKEDEGRKKGRKKGRKMKEGRKKGGNDGR